MSQHTQTGVTTSFPSPEERERIERHRAALNQAA